MRDTGAKRDSNAEQTSEYLLLNKLRKKFPRLRLTLLELFSIDLRTLALTRIVLAVILLINYAYRLPDLRAFYSDDGVLPRAAIHQSFPHSWAFSLHFFSGRTELEGLMFLIGGLFTVLLLLGFKTRLVSFWTWFLFSSLCLRSPFVTSGDDSLLRMMLFWGIFVPWGARYSVDSSLNPTPGGLPKSVFSIGCIALLLQMPMVYFFTGILKNGLEWRHDFTAIWYSLKAPDFVLPIGVWLTSYPGWLKVFTAATLVIEMAGALLLFCPFRTKTVRFFVVLALFLLQLSLALTLKLGLFPVVSVAALLPFVSSSFWDRLISRLRTPQRSGIRIYYDADCGFCRKTLRVLATFFLLPGTNIQPAQTEPEIDEEMRQLNSWVVIDHRGTRHYKFDALIEVFRASPLLWPTVPILRWRPLKSFGTRLYEWVANTRGRLTPLLAGLRYRRVRVRQPLWLTLVCVFCLGYVIADNMGSVARSPIRIPAKVTAVGEVLNIQQRWGMFAPSPARSYRWYVMVGKLRDGREIDLWSGGPVSWERPANHQPWVNNGRWRTYMFHLGLEKRRSLRPYFARYVCRSWNEKHQGGDTAEEVTLYSRIERITPDESAPPDSKTTLLWKHVCTSVHPGEATDESYLTLLDATQASSSRARFND